MVIWRAYKIVIMVTRGCIDTLTILFAGLAWIEIENTNLLYHCLLSRWILSPHTNQKNHVLPQYGVQTEQDFCLGEIQGPRCHSVSLLLVTKHLPWRVIVPSSTTKYRLLYDLQARSTYIFNVAPPMSLLTGVVIVVPYPGFNIAPYLLGSTGGKFGYNSHISKHWNNFPYVISPLFWCRDNRG